LIAIHCIEWSGRRSKGRAAFHQRPALPQRAAVPAAAAVAAGTPHLPPIASVERDIPLGNDGSVPNPSTPAKSIERWRAAVEEPTATA
jgi:hypothetical protein